MRVARRWLSAYLILALSHHVTSQACTDGLTQEHFYCCTKVGTCNSWESELQVIFEDDTVEVTCNSPSLSSVRLADFLQSVKLQRPLSLRELTVSNCPAPGEGSSYRDWVSRLASSVTTLNTLKLDNVKTTSRLQAKDFAGLLNLKTLHLNHSLKKLDVSILSSLTKLVEIRCQGCNEVGKNAFRHNGNLSKLNLANSHITSLHKDTFRGLINLKELNLKYNKLASIPQNIFKNLTQLEKLNLRHNNISSLPSNLLYDLLNLKTLLICQNPISKLPENFLRNNPRLLQFMGTAIGISEIPSNIFANATQLKVIRLGENNISSLPESVFQDLKYLKTLELDKNKLNNQGIKKYTFKDQQSLEKIDLSHNQFTSPITHLLQSLKSSLTTVKLRNNSLTTFEEEWCLSFPRLVGQTKCELDLSENMIEGDLNQRLLRFNGSITVNLERNRIRRIFMKLTNPAPCNQTCIVLKLSDNDIVCDCHAIELQEILNAKSGQCIKVRGLENYKCPQLNNQILKEVKATSLSCPISCTNLIREEDCSCSYSNASQVAKVDCSRRTSSQVSEGAASIKNIEIILSHRNITNLKKLFYKDTEPKIATIDASYNEISRLDIPSLPPNLMHISLANNRIPGLSEDLLSFLINNVSTVNLGNNPFLCDCSSQPFIHFLDANSQKVKDIQDIYFNCSSPLQYKNENFTDLLVCQRNHSAFILSTLVPLSSIILLLLLISWKRETLQLRLFSLPIVLRHYPEDWSLLYDVFISYSHHDEDFVEKVFWNRLEKEYFNFK